MKMKVTGIRLDRLEPEALRLEQPTAEQQQAKRERDRRFAMRALFVLWLIRLAAKIIYRLPR